VDTSISPCNDYTIGSINDVYANLFFEVTDVSTQMDLEWKTAGFQQFPNAGFALPGAATTGGWIEKQVNGLCWHLPMLQCRGLFPQNGMLDVGTWR
jgi:hypothetical protein